MPDVAVTLMAHVVAPSELAGAWTVEPFLVVTLAVTATVFGRGTARLGRRIPRPDASKRAASFYAGLAVVAAALMSPLDALAHALFSAHMTQHLVLMTVAAPLLAYARPGAALMAGLPAGGRDMARRAGLRSSGGLGRAAHALAHPLVVWSIGAVVLWAWHMPSLYELALSHDAVHALEHASFLGAALLFWGVVFRTSARRGVGRPLAALLVFGTGAQSAALGAVLLFASMPLYPVHDVGARLWHTSPLHDQQLAGALMWGPPGVVYVVTMAWLLVRWFQEMEKAPAEGLLVTAGEAR